MLFRLCNTSATFERLMKVVLCGLNWKTGLVYIDDIMVMERTFEGQSRDGNKYF